MTDNIYQVQYHYTYLITDLVPESTERYYIGVHTSNIPPIKDINYMSSSNSIKALDTISLEKIIIQEFSSRKLASSHEIKLHSEYDVKNNPLFYNRCNATSTGFSSLVDAETKKKMIKKRNNPNWKRTKGKEQSHNMKLTRNNPNWKRTIGAEIIKKVKITTNSIKWQETTGKIKKEKMRIALEKTKGYYYTPFGKFWSAHDQNLITAPSLIKWCKKNNIQITKMIYVKSKYLQSLGSEVINKTFKDLGFYYKAPV